MACFVKFLVFVNLINCAAYHVSSQIAERQIQQKQEVVQAFFEQFENVEITYHFKPHGMEARGINCSCFIASRNSARFTQTIEAKDGFGFVEEMLVQENKQLVSGRQRFSSDKQEPPSDPVLSGDLNWRESQFLNQPRFFWMGFFWDGKKYVDVRDASFWQAKNTLRENGTLSLQTKNGAEFIFEFMEWKDSFRVVGIRLEFAHPNQDQGDNEKRFSFPITLQYDDESNEFTGWSLTEKLPGQSKPSGFEQRIIATAKIEKNVEAPLKFKVLNVKDGSRVLILRSGDNFRYQYEQGLLRKVIDKTAIEVIDELCLEFTRETGVARDVMSQTILKADYLSDTDAEPHCGVYALCGAAALFGRIIPIEALIENDELAGPQGASATAMETAAIDYGLHAKIVRNAGFRALAKLNSPALLHFGDSTQSDRFSHWVTFCGLSDNGKFKILDLPNRPVEIEAAVLLTSWDGTAIILSDARIPKWKYWISRNWVLFYVFGFILFSAIIIARRANKRTSNRIAFECATILLTTLFVAITWMIVLPESYARNPLAVGLTKAKVYSGKEDIRTANAFPDNWSDYLIVDCRDTYSYQVGHIPDAVSFPIDSSLIEAAVFAESNLANQKRVIVYCQNRHCNWAQQSAHLLATLGFQNVSVFEPGWDGYGQQN